MVENKKISVGDNISYIKGEDIHGWEEKGYGVVVSISNDEKTYFIKEKNKYVSIHSHRVLIKKGETYE